MSAWGSDFQLGHQSREKGNRVAWLRHLTPVATSSLDTLNRTLWAWVEGEFHLSPHRDLDGRTPLDQWALAGHNPALP